MYVLVCEVFKEGFKEWMNDIRVMEIKKKINKLLNDVN